MIDLFFWDHVYLAELGAWPFIRRSLAFYGFMSWFSTIEAQIIVHAMFSFSRSEASSALEFSFGLGRVYFGIWGFPGIDFPDLSIGIATRSLGSTEGSLGTSVKAPVSIKISGFIDKCS
jgi:hypothetical protein